MTAMERSISPYDLRGSEVNMADSLGINYYYAEDDETLEALKQGAGDSELQKRVDEMRQLQTLIDDLRASEKTLNALTPGLSHYELQQMLDDMREMCADGSAGSVGTLEEQMTSLKKIVDEAIVLQEYEVCAGGKIIKVHTVEIEQDPNKVEGGKGDILTRADLTAEPNLLPEVSCSTLEGTISHLRSRVIGSGTIMKKDKVHQLEKGHSKTLEDNTHQPEKGK